VKLTNPMERRICLRVEASADIGQRYCGVDGRGILDSKEAALVSFTLRDGDVKHGDFFTIWTMYAFDFNFEEFDFPISQFSDFPDFDFDDRDH
jgi:hypothetical protein